MFYYFYYLEFFVNALKYVQLQTKNILTGLSDWTETQTGFIVESVSAGL